MKFLIPLIPLLVLSACSTTQSRVHPAQLSSSSMGANITLNTFHQAAKAGAFELYFDQMTDDVVFMGTDETEHWNKQQFMDYAREPFSDGHGWTYNTTDRNLRFNHDFTIAWADELLSHDKYGTLRGTAVLEKQNDKWLIAQYSLTFLVPNDIAGEVVETIRKFEESND